MSLKNYWNIELQKGQRLWFMSDPHYGQKNIVKGVTDWSSSRKVRDFDTIEEMNKTIVNNINSLVRADDILICLGDWSFGGFENIPKFRNELLCKNIYLILGNHDDHIDNNKNGYRSLFVDVAHYKILKVKTYVPHEILKANQITQMFVLQHYPIASWRDMKDGFIHLFGHLHCQPDRKIMKGKSMDVGMDGNNLKPYSFEEIMHIMRRRPIANNILNDDHHTKILRKKNLGSLQWFMDKWNMYLNRAESTFSFLGQYSHYR